MSMPGHDCITNWGGLAAVHIARIKAAAAVLHELRKNETNRDERIRFRFYRLKSHFDYFKQ